MYEVSVSSTFSASHELRGYPGECARVHGHNWRVRVRVSVEEIDELGMGVDFRGLRGALDKIIRDLDHRHLNDLEPFQGINPTAERIARLLFSRIGPVLPEGVTVLETRVEEAERDWAAYRE